MLRKLARLVADRAMILGLVLLCAYFSVATYSEQQPTGANAARLVAALIDPSKGGATRIVIVARRESEDAAFSKSLESDLTQAGALVLAVVVGEPKDARDVLLKIADSGGKIDVIACSAATSSWLVFADLATDFPSLGNPKLVKPESFMWPSFLNAENLVNIADQNAIIAIMAIGMTMVIITGGIDLSVGSLLALAAVLAARGIRDFGGGGEASPLSMTIACAAAIAVCGIIGAFSASMITRLDVPPFIVTLSMMLIASGFAYTCSKGQSIDRIPDAFMGLQRGAAVLSIPNAVLLMMILYAIAHVVMTRTWLGRYLYAVGGNREASRLSGVPVRRVIVFAYVVNGLLAGVGGVLFASQFKSGSATYGEMYELYVIAAVVVGGTSLSGGEGTLFGTLVGAFTIGVIRNGMNLTNVDPYSQKIVLGIVILGAVLLDRIRPRQ